MINSRFRGALVAVAALALLLFFQHRTAPIALGDPDRFFHLALARETVASGKLWLSRLPQFTGLGWDRQFPDKEFLFHLVNRGLQFLGGEAAVLKIIPIASGMILLSLLSLVSGQAGLMMGSVIVLAGLVFDPYLLIRLGMLRPHLLAILFFTLILHGLIRTSAGWVFAAAAAYS